MTARFERLEAKMQAEGLEALLVTNQNNVYYLTGFWGTFGAVLLTGKRRILLTDSRYIILAKSKAKDFEVIAVTSGLAASLKMVLEKEKIGQLAVEDDMSLASFRGYQESLAPVSLKVLSAFVEELRLIKDPEEIEAIQKACQISDQAFIDALDFIQPGKTDQQVANFLEYRMKELGGQGASFDIIAVSGQRSAMPHGTPSDKVIEAGDALTVDFGTFYNHYVSDLTRTVFVGHVTDQQAEVYQTVLKANQTLIGAAKAGLEYRDYDAIARSVIDQAGYGSYFTHSIGHGIGLDIHENPFFRKGDRRLLQPGMVVTDEPGIYLEGQFGVRIEDDLLIRVEGCQVLTQAPKELIIL